MDSLIILGINLFITLAQNCENVIFIFIPSFFYTDKNYINPWIHTLVLQQQLMPTFSSY